MESKLFGNMTHPHTIDSSCSIRYFQMKDNNNKIEKMMKRQNKFWDFL